MEQQEQESEQQSTVVVEADNSNATTEDSIDNNTTDSTIYYGGCHCGNVRYKVYIQHSVNDTTGGESTTKNIIDDCNCSICIQKGYLHYVVDRKQFILLNNIDINNDKDIITTYTFNTCIAQHKFCNNCGIHSYYIPRSNPNSISINIHCLDEYINNSKQCLSNFTIVPFNGKNWESNITALHDQQPTNRNKQQTTMNKTNNNE